jgi:hypothetical protein
MDPQDVSNFMQLVHTHAWAPIAIIIMLWLYRMLGDDSKFPITWPAGWAKWKPMVIIVLGQAICVVKAISVDHIKWFVAIEHGGALAFMALGGVHILQNWWPVPGTEPKWLRFLMLIGSRVIAVAEVSVTVAQEAKSDGGAVTATEKDKLTIPKS